MTGPSQNQWNLALGIPSIIGTVGVRRSGGGFGQYRIGLLGRAAATLSKLRSSDGIRKPVSNISIASFFITKMHVENMRLSIVRI
ncbi:hypothetical protein [Bifidobacterium catenulatum]|uniref:hypothetical protein n=1 Tax=Bifidobacterium catenulatum TaxID=1686 RepID=UPI0005B565BA|nr:hypothetical protein [Bifidobacterium catenulatum]MDH7871051.1 hypothetical protein [Bifidobacterium catenulatum subsp. kashiwanohense]MDH7887794.1 hypothetical protein [Bifidobacterium catenulatum subsp. kashiwanohense]MDH7897417.1 hypothetical protein [Bifidobacterium catenulatum subsp. kashiwanohense]BAQ28865.1 hypothetical protein BBKW_0730 [Bifidobacterium catenulatum subsp. kashiwanohense JCM 15439 = DSM 21854]